MAKTNRPLIRKHLKSIRFDSECIEIMEMYAKENDCSISTANIELLKLGGTFWLQNQYTESDK